MPDLKIDRLEKSYGLNKILNGISLKIGTGEFVSLLGPSGSGKTTILRCIAGLEIPDASSGEIMLGGQALSGAGKFVPPEKRNLGMVFQNYAVWPHMNVFDNVAFPLRIKGTDGVNEKTSNALGLVKLKGYEKRFAHELSGGQQQRVALARALAMSPNALLLDEPLSNLDALLREELGAEIRRLQKELNLTTILVTHDQKEALSLSDRIILLDQGRIDAEGAPEELYSRPPTPFATSFLSGAQNLKRAGTAKTYLPRRWRVKGVSPNGPYRIVSRIFLGAEYEYWAEHSELSEPVRFFSPERVDIKDRLDLEYSE